MTMLDEYGDNKQDGRDDDQRELFLQAALFMVMVMFVLGMSMMVMLVVMFVLGMSMVIMLVVMMFVLAGAAVRMLMCHIFAV